MGPHSLFGYFIVGCLAAGCHPAFFQSSIGDNPNDNVFFLSALTSCQHIYNAEPTLQFKGLNFWEASAALALTLLF